MYKEEYDRLVEQSKEKLDYYNKNFLGFFISSMLAGIYVGLGIVLIFSIGGQLQGSPATKLAMGCSFGIALSLVLMAGANLFTGNNLVLSAGLFKKEISLNKVLKYWFFCFIGNWVGAIILAFLFVGSGLNNEYVSEFIAKSTYAKVTIPLHSMIIRAILCNILVCLATWCTVKLKSESGKLIMIFWCLFGFITTGFEHSVANMSLLTIGLLNPVHYDITLASYFYNIFVVTLGNMIGGIIFVSLPYFLISKD